MRFICIICLLSLPVLAGALKERALQLMGGAEKIVFIERRLYKDGHYYRNFGGDAVNPNDWYHAPDGSAIRALNLKSGRVETVLEDASGNFRDVRVNYEGTRLLFAWRRAGAHNYNLYESDADGGNVKQLTFGWRWDDFGAEYLPDGGIVFCSSRGRRFIPCNHSPGAQLFRMDGDGKNMLMLSANNVRDDHPAVLHNGQIVYDRWEYVDASIAHYRDIWTMNPDGTAQMVAFGGNAAAWIARRQRIRVKGSPTAIPGAPGKVVFTLQPWSGLRENTGHVAVADLSGGPDAFDNYMIISPPRPAFDERWPEQGWLGGEDAFHSPCALASDCFLVVENRTIYAMDDHGNLEKLYEAPIMAHDPRPVMARPREPVLASKINRALDYGTFVVSDIYKGRNAEMAGVARGTIKTLLVMEDLPKPVSYFSLPGLLSCDGSHTLRRIVGTAKVYEDGSCAFKAPALRGLYFVALDKDGLAVKRMQSYTMVMPGEHQGCVGCHENRTVAKLPDSTRGRLQALAGEVQSLEPCADVPDIICYPSDVQPVMDRNCVSCHNPDRKGGPAGRVLLTGDRTEWFSQSYYSLCAYEQVSYMQGRYNYEHREHEPYGFGSGASGIMKKIDGHHHGVQMSARDRDVIRLWIESSCTFPGTYAVWNTPESAVAGAQQNVNTVKIGAPLEGIVYNRCLVCHDSEAMMGRRVRNRVRMNEPKHCWNLYDLSYPEKSMILNAPLCSAAGGWGWCKEAYGREVVFFSKDDRDYQAILGAIKAASARQIANKSLRPDLPGFVPNPHYVRWMKTWGVLPSDAKAEDVNAFETDRCYFESLWYKPGRVDIATANEPEPMAPLPVVKTPQPAVGGESCKEDVPGVRKEVDLLAGKTLADFDAIGPEAGPRVIGDTFEIKDGVLTMNGTHAAVLMTKALTEADFTLTMEVSYATGAFGDAGFVIGLRSDSQGYCGYTGLEVQGKTTDIGDVWGWPGYAVARDTAARPDGYLRVPRLAAVGAEAGAWNRLEIAAYGGVVTVKWNGSVVNRCRVTGATAGRIGFQTQPYPNGRVTVRCRKVCLR